MQSAHKASELHKKRTGKALRITEQIVFNDETYEEEDTWMPSQSFLGPQLQTSSADFNSRVEAYLEQKIAMSSFIAAADRQHQNQRWGEIDRLFAESFPNAAQTARLLAEDLVPSQESSRSRNADSQQPLNITSEDNQHRHQSIALPHPQTAAPETLFSPEDYLSPGTDSSQNTTLYDSPFTADLPPEVLLILGHDNPNSRNSFDDDLKITTQEASFDAFGDAGFASCFEDAHKSIGGEDVTLWNDELEAYFDSTAWLDYPMEDQALT